MNDNIKTRIQQISIPVSGTIREAMQAIDRGGLGIALLTDPFTLEFRGLVTDGDIRRALLFGKGLESPVQQVTRPDPKTARIGTSTDELTRIFSEPVRVIPLLNTKNQVEDLALFDKRMHIPVAEPLISDQEIRYVTECIVTGWISSSGKYVSQFEDMFARFCGSRYAVSTSSGTTALHLALLALGIGPGDEVIVPSLTFIATANAVTYTGAKPIFVDCCEDTWNINPALAETAITSRTKAIVPVHLYGHPADMDPLRVMAEKQDIFIIEDAAEAHGAEYKGRRAGGIGDIGVFSFYGNKIVTTGEGGMIVTNRQDIADKIRLFRDHGMVKNRRYWHTVLGYNYRLTNIQAALGVAQMEKIDSIIGKKIAIAYRYSKNLKGIPGITLPPEKEWAKNVYWMYSVLVNKKRFGMSRDTLMEYLERENIETRPFFPPLHTQPIYTSGQNLPVSEKLSSSGINLPSAVTIPLEQIDWICKCISAAHTRSSD